MSEEHDETNLSSLENDEMQDNEQMMNDEGGEKESTEVDDNSYDTEGEEGSETEEDTHPQKRKRYNKFSKDKFSKDKFSKVKCPSCTQHFDASSIRYSFARTALIYSCPRCMTILSINSKTNKPRRNYNTDYSTDDN